jgi:phospholipid transport system substrate-binding protein
MPNQLKKVLQSAAVAALLLVAFGRAFAADAAPAPAQGQAQAPDELIKGVAQDVLKDLDAHRAEYRKDPKQIRVMVDKHLLPHFDTEFAARRVLAKYWNSASEDQRKRFIEAFYQSLLQNYGEAIIDFTPDRLKVLPFRGDASSNMATVRTEIRRDNGTIVPVNYSVHKTADGQWKAFDVTIEGVSYVKSFQADFGGEIERNGLDSVIKRMEQQVASGVPSKNAPGKKSS